MIESTPTKEAVPMDVQELEVSVATQGEIPEAAKQYATDKVTQLVRFTRRPILFVQVKLTLEPNPAQERPALAEATLDVNGRPVRAHVAGHDLMEAVDLLEERLRRRLERSVGRLDRTDRNGSAKQGEWRHGDLPTPRPEYFDRPVEEREVVRHKTFALEPMTCDEAAFDLDMLGHDFYLFTDVESGDDSVIFHTEGEDHLELMQAGDGARVPENCAAPVRASTQRPGEMDLSEAEERLDASHEPFVFFVNVDSGRGNVVYRRYDGHYGLITPA
jgi:ribosomal subunit interface protein